MKNLVKKFFHFGIFHNSNIQIMKKNIIEEPNEKNRAIFCLFSVKSYEPNRLIFSAFMVITISSLKVFKHACHKDRKTKRISS